MQYFTEDGKEAMRKYLESLEQLLLKTHKFPIKLRFYGFPSLELESRDELYIRIMMLRDLVNMIKLQDKEDN